MRGVFLDTASVDREDLDLTGLKATLDDWSLPATTADDDVAAAIDAATVVVSNKVRLDREVLQGAASLKLVCIAATGTNNIDLDAARDCDITVCNARGYATRSVVEHVFSLILSHARQAHDYRQAVRDGAWARSPTFALLDFPLREIAGQTLGIIGYGELGQAVAEAGRAFGMDILVAQRPGGPAVAGRVPLEDLLAAADIVSLHSPLTPDTHHLIDAAALARMKNTALLINTARGGIVHEADLKQALLSGQIGAAALDVLEEEPPSHDHPLLDDTIPNLVITPHIAWASTAARQALIDEISENIRSFLAGTPRNIVTAG